jgi:HAE1 family hydrophobic/amphiphilic exporter-1
MATLIVVVLGLFSLGRLPLDLMPELTFPIITVRTTYENASPSEIEEQITKPLERVLVAVPGIKNISSTSMEGASSIFLEFVWGTNLDEATNDIRDRIDRIIRRLPDDIDRPLLQKFDISSRPIMFLGVASDFHPVDLKRYIDDEISYRLERSPGVASASSFGGLDREIKVEVDQAEVKALGLDLYSLVTQVQNENLTEAGGEIDRGRLSVAVRTKGEFTALSDLGSIIVARNAGGSPVRLQDIADITDNWAKVTRVTRINGRDGQFMGVFKQSGANTVEVADQANLVISDINKTLSNLKLFSLFDSSTYIKLSLKTVSNSALTGGILAVIVILFFLQHIRSTLVLGLSIPISIITTFMVMYFFGLTFNVVTLGALALGVGMLVDNAIVVLDNIFRLRATGLPSDRAASEGTDEVAGAITASTLTTLSVFLPMIFLDGLAGVMFRPFSLTIAFALTASLAVSLTVVPMLSSQLLKEKPRPAQPEVVGDLKTSGLPGQEGEPEKPKYKFGKPRYFRNLFKVVEVTYLGWLDKSLARPWTVIILAVVMLGASAAVIPSIGTEFMPRTDESAFRVNVTLEPGTKVEKTSEFFKTIENIVIKEVPELLTMSSDIGGSGGRGDRGSHTAEMMVKIKPIAERDRSVFEILEHLRPILTGLPGGIIRLRADQSFLAGGGGSDRIQVELRGNNIEESIRLTKAMKKIIEKVPGVSDVYLANEDATLEEVIIIDRDRAADAKVSVASVTKLIKTALGGTTAGYFRENGKEYAINVSLKDSETISISELMNLPVTNALGQTVILSNIAKAVPGAGPLKITRKNQARISVLNADLTDRPLGDVVADIDLELKKLPMGSDFSYNFTGEAEEQQEAFSGLITVLAMAVFLVYMIMACQFEQLKGPLVIMFSLPFAAIGVIWIHLLTGTSFNINSFIGVIMLAGIVVNNAIILTDHANLLRRRDGLELLPALRETGRRRLRPILMTTLTTILGLVPMSLGLGEGGESQAPLGRAVIGGLTSSTFITLFVVPVCYALFFRKEDLRLRAGRNLSPEKPQPDGIPPLAGAPLPEAQPAAHLEASPEKA